MCCVEPARSVEAEPRKAEPSLNRDTLRFLFAFLAVFGAALFLVRPDPTTAQTVFRIALVATGTIGLAVMQRRR